MDGSMLNGSKFRMKKKLPAYHSSSALFLADQMCWSDVTSYIVQILQSAISLICSDLCSVLSVYFCNVHNVITTAMHCAVQANNVRVEYVSFVHFSSCSAALLQKQFYHL